MSAHSAADPPVRAGRAGRVALWLWSLLACPLLTLGAVVVVLFAGSYEPYGPRVALMLALPALLSAAVARLATSSAREAVLAAIAAVAATWALVLAVAVVLSLAGAYA
jgi:hypothetical protein